MKPATVKPRAWSEMRQCPDCQHETLRVWWSQLAGTGAPAKRVDEFCDNPDCARGEVAGPAR